jgi:inosose dehydratase
MLIANAPCSWGILEFESTAARASPVQVLEEIAATGYEGTELGDWGFFATDPRQLAADLERRHLALAGAFVDVALTDPGAHATGEAVAVKIARLLAGVVRLKPDATDAVRQKLDATEKRSESGSIEANENGPMIVLSDATARVPERTAKAGRITPDEGLTPDQWDVAAAGAERIARAVRESTGLRTAFHHHCATYVETPEEIDALMQRTSSDVLGLCLDTGHATFGGGDPVTLIKRYRDRIWHVHFKDCSPAVAERARSERWDYLTAIRHGLFCELGDGEVDFRGALDRLRLHAYAGWIVVEQDVLPSMGTPAASARRNRAFLHRLGL